MAIEAATRSPRRSDSMEKYPMHVSIGGSCRKHDPGACDLTVCTCTVVCRSDRYGAKIGLAAGHAGSISPKDCCARPGARIRNRATDYSRCPMTWFGFLKDPLSGITSPGESRLARGGMAGYGYRPRGENSTGLLVRTHAARNRGRELEPIRLDSAAIGRRRQMSWIRRL